MYMTMIYSRAALLYATVDIPTLLRSLDYYLHSIYSEF